MTLERVVEQLNHLSNHHGAILFDLDGTLMNTEPLHAKALSTYFHRDDLEKLLERFIGVADTDVFYKLQKEKLLPATLSLNQFLKDKNETMARLISELSDNEFDHYLTPSLLAFLNHPKIKKIKKAVVSASESLVVERLLQKKDLRKNFVATFYRGLTFKSKPSASPYLLAMRELSLSTSKTMIFEDSPTGTRAALESGALVVRITHNLPDKGQNHSFKNLINLNDFSPLCKLL